MVSWGGGGERERTVLPTHRLGSGGGGWRGRERENCVAYTERGKTEERREWGWLGGAGVEEYGTRGAERRGGGGVSFLATSDNLKMGIGISGRG